MEASEKEITRLSKFLSLVLRHQPDLIGITLDAQGWTEIEELIQKSELHGTYITRALLQRVVETNAKKRFSSMVRKTK